MLKCWHLAEAAAQGFAGAYKTTLPLQAALDSSANLGIFFENHRTVLLANGKVSRGVVCEQHVTHMEEEEEEHTTQHQQKKDIHMTTTTRAQTRVPPLPRVPEVVLTRARV